MVLPALFHPLNTISTSSDHSITTPSSQMGWTRVNQVSIYLIDIVRERSKSIVDLLSNEELLEEEREKAKKIRDRMSNVIGDKGMSYGAQGSFGSGYDSYSNKNQGTSSSSTSYTNYGNSGLGQYGDYTNHKSTLDKYKNK